MQFRHLILRSSTPFYTVDRRCHGGILAWGKDLVMMTLPLTRVRAGLDRVNQDGSDWVLK